MNFIIAVTAASCGWFAAAALLFFNPFVNQFYKPAEAHPAVKPLAPGAATPLKILGAVALQCVLWALVYRWIKPGLPASTAGAGTVFGGIIFLMKILPRDIDRLLLTTYPAIRMAVEFVVGLVCAFTVSFTYAALL